MQRLIKLRMITSAERSPDCFWLFAIISCLAYCPLPRCPSLRSPVILSAVFPRAVCVTGGRERKRESSQGLIRETGPPTLISVSSEKCSAMSPRRLQRDKLSIDRALPDTHFAKLTTIMDSRSTSRLRHASLRKHFVEGDITHVSIQREISHF